MECILVTDQDEGPAQETARKGNGKAAGKHKDGRIKERGQGAGQGRDQKQGRNRGREQDQSGVQAGDPEPAPARTAETREQARAARRALNQLAREAARAERRTERAQRKQEQGKQEQGKQGRADRKTGSGDDGAKPAGRNRDRQNGAAQAADGQDHDARPEKPGKNRSGDKKHGQAKQDRADKPGGRGFVPFVPVPVPVADAAPDLVVAAPLDDVESAPFNILLIGQAGPLARQAVIFAASLRMFSPKWRGRLIVAEPQPEGAWSGTQTRMGTVERDLLTGFGAEILPFTARHFGRGYPYGNKIEALSLLPAAEPFVFFDSDTIITGPLGRCAIDFSRPAASMRREGSWPEPPLYGPGYSDIWRSLYDRLGLDFESSLDPDQPDEHWERYLYFNAGWFLGDDPAEFGRRFLDWSLAVRNEPGEALASQSLDPWLDQAVLPLVVHALGGGRPGPGLDGFDNGVTCHYRNLSLLYARETDSTIAAMEQVLDLPALRPLMQQDAGYDRLVRQGAGRERIRPIFAGKPLPSKEKAIRQELKKQGLWFGR